MNRIIKYTFLTIYILIIIVLIVESLKSGEESAKISNDVTDVIVDIVENTNTDIPDIIVDKFIEEEINNDEIESLRTSNNFKYFIRKLFGHFGAYFILGFITFITFNIFWSNKTKTLIWSLIFGVVFSIITELLQFIPIGRYPSVKDVVINFTGYINGTLIILVIYIVYTKIKERKISSN